MAMTLGELAERLGCELRGNAAVDVDHVDSLVSAGSTAVSFLSNSALKAKLADVTAAAVILRESDADDCPVAAIVTDNPYATYARAAAILHPAPAVLPGIHSSAVIDDTASVAASAQVSANAVIDGNAVIGEHCCVGPGSYVGPDCVVGTATRLLANTTLVRKVRIGERCIVHSGAVLGCDGFGNAMSKTGWVKVPQIGGVDIGDDVEIGANTTVDCGAIGDTVLENGVRLDNLVQIAHNCRVGEHTAMAAQSAIAGSAVIGARCMFAGQSGSVGHVTICDDVVITGQTMITKSITEPGAYSAGWAGEPSKSWARTVARVRRLGSLIERVSKLEKDKG